MTNKKFNLKKVLLLAAILGASVHECSWAGLRGGGSRSGSQDRTAIPVAKSKQLTPFQSAINLLRTVFKPQSISDIVRLPPLSFDETLKTNLASGIDDQFKNDMNKFFQNKDVWFSDNQNLDKLPGEENVTVSQCIVRGDLAPFSTTLTMGRDDQNPRPITCYTLKEGRISLEPRSFSRFVTDHINNSVKTLAVYVVESYLHVLLYDLHRAGKGVFITEFLKETLKASPSFAGMVSSLQQTLNDFYNAIDRSNGQINAVESLFRKLSGANQQDLKNNFFAGIKQYASDQKSQKNHMLLIRRKDNESDEEISVAVVPLDPARSSANKEEFLVKISQIMAAQTDDSGKIKADRRYDPSKVI